VKKVFLFLFLIIVFISSCVKEKLNSDSINRKAQNFGAVVPVGYLQSSLENLYAQQLQNGTLQKDAEGLLWLKYPIPFDTLQSDSLIIFPDKSQQYNFPASQDIDLILITDSLVLQDTFYVDFGFSNGAKNEQLDSIRLYFMQMQAEMLSSYNLSARMELIFPKITFHEKAYRKNIIVNSNSLYSDFKDISIHLEKNNQTPVVIQLTLWPSADSIPKGANIVNLKLDLTQITFEGIYGYLDKIDIPLPSATSSFDFYNKKISGSFHFTHSYLKFISNNPFGMPISFFLQSMQSTTADQSTQQIVLNDFLSPKNPAAIAFPKLSEEGQSLTDSSSIEITDLQLFGDNYLTTVTAKIQGQSNPNGNTDYNFLLRNTQLALDLEFDIPFWGYTQDLVLQDTLNFNINDFYSGDKSRIDKLAFILNFTNGFPIEAQPQIYFYDSNKQLLDSLFNRPPTLPSSGQLDENGKIIPNEIPAIQQEVSSPQTVLKTSYIIMRSRLKTPDTESQKAWKFYAEYSLYTQIGIAVKLLND